MTIKTHRWRRAAATAATTLGVASLALVAGSLPASADPVRTAATSTDTTYLSDTLGLPANSVVETVTYDRFQWQLQQPGQFAYLIGDPGDTGFKAEAVAVDAAARAAGVRKVYWFNPNLSGSAATNGTQSAALNLDTRNPSGITTLAAASQTSYDKTWKNLLGQYLGNGIKSVITLSGEGGNATITTDDTVVNDAVNPLWDYRSSPAATPLGASQDAFFIYDKDHTSGAATDKIISGVNLSTDAGYAAGVAAAFAAIGGANIDQLSQFDFFKASFNKKYGDQNAAEKAAGATLIDDSDNAQPWAVKQITYPELIHLLNIKDSVKDFVILFGGSWCPNTQAVIESVNRYAQENNVTVYNFDTVLDGGITNSGTTSASDPLQSRNTANNGSTPNANPSYLYANILTTFLKNIVTQYDLNNGTYVTYYPNGNTSSALAAVRKLQVPFVISYQRGTGSSVSSTAVSRQWIQQKIVPSTGLPSYTEYMTTLTYTNPATGTGRLGLTNAQFPTAIPTIPGVAGFDWKNPVYPDPSTFVDASQYLTTAESDALTAALAAVPGSAQFRTVADVNAAKTAAQAAASPDATLIANLTTIAGTWSTVTTRKGSVTTRLANYQFGQEAIGKLAYFFGGLPGGVVSNQTVTAPSVTAADTPQITVAIANDYGRVPTGDVTLALSGSSYKQPVAANAASFTLPKLSAGSYNFSLSYPGDDQILPFSKAGTLLVTPAASAGGGGGGGGATVTTNPSVSNTTAAGGSSNAPLTPPAVTTAKYKVTVGTVAPTTAKAGKYTVTVVTPSSSPKATGTVTVKLKKGAATRTLRGSLAKGAVAIAVPKLQAGVWSVAIAYLGDANYDSASTSGSLVVAKAKVSKVNAAFTVKPVTTKAGKVKVTFATPSGGAAATGKVTLKVTNGATTKVVTGSLAGGSLTALLPKLDKGTWSIAVSWPGDANYQGASAKSSVAVTD